MTAPPQQAQQQPQDDNDAALIAAIIAALLLLHSVHAVTARLRVQAAAAGIGPAALKAAIALVLTMPQQPMEGTGPATRWAVQTNEIRRGAFALAAMHRIQRAADEAKAQGQPVIDAIGAQIQAERRWFAAHVGASNGRMAAASAVDGMASVHGNLLGWQAVKDDRCSPGCRKASGSNFYADDPPVIEGSPSLPGAVHPRCRCYPVLPFHGARVMPGTGPRR